MRTDEELMEAYAAGEQEAFRELFRRTAPALAAFLRHDLSRRQDANDLLQQVFLQLHRARHDYRSGAPLRPWLFTIALNVKREHLRRLGRHREAPIERAPEAIADSAPEPEAREQRARVRRALAELPSNQRDVIVLHWFDGLSFPEIARVVGARLSAVKVRASRGYESLRRILGDGV
jgi:RNA polymerase sigma factor (sigma-70 family)